jgi:hypothetical protein
MTDNLIARLGLILLVASLVAIGTQRARLPYSVGLVAAGIGLSFLPRGIVLPLTPTLIFTVFLPPLVFEAALNIGWRAFRRDMAVILALAFAGVAIAATVVAAGMHLLVGWPWISAGLFGVLIAATDPVSVIAAFREIKVDSRLALLIEAESLVNDGAAAVGFTALVGLLSGPETGPAAFAASFLWTVLGGVLIGGLLSGALLLLAGRTSDHLVEITLTTIAAYGSFLIAQRLGASGVLASLTAGMVVGNVAHRGQPRLCAVILAIRRFPSELARLHSDRRLRGRSDDEAGKPDGVRRDRAVAARPRRRRLSALRAVRPFFAQDQRPLSAYPGLGRSSRRAGAGPGFGAAPDPAGSVSDHRLRFRRRHLLHLRPGFDSAAAHAAAEASLTDGPSRRSPPSEPPPGELDKSREAL